MTSSDILTGRLRLIMMTLDMIHADAQQDGKLADLVGAHVPSAWPPENWEPHVFPFLEKQYAETPHAAPWNRYVVLRANPPTLIGTMGGFPKGESEAEVGYSILPSWQGRGLATEGMLAFLEELFRDGKLKSITAQTFPSLHASIRVMEKCGFRRDGSGDEEGTVRYRLDRPYQSGETVFTLGGIRTFHGWTHACLGMLLDHLATIPPIDYARALPAAGLPALRDQVIHVFDCEGFWVHALQGLAYVNRAAAQCPAISDARLYQQEVIQGTQAYLSTLTDQQLNSQAALHFSDGDGASRTPAFVLHHVLTHAFHHKGRIVAACRALGYPARDTDLSRIE